MHGTGSRRWLVRTVPSAAEWKALSSAIAGDVVLPGADEYESLRKPAMARFWDVRPAAVVCCRTPEDVVEALAVARRSDTAVTARSGGHCFDGGSSSSGVVLEVGPMNAASISGGAVTVGAGARLAKLTSAARDWLARSWALTHAGGGAYPNFPDADLGPWDAAYHGANLDRLLQVKARYDPEGTFGDAR